MLSMIRLLLITVCAASVAVMIPSSLAFADDPGGVEQHRPAAGQTVGLIELPKPAREIISGVVASVDERRDTITIQRSQAKTEELKVQDGLLFSAVRYGDRVEVSVENINGAKTIVGLVKR
jgi:Copper binding periplasmic protein CusF